MNLEQFANYQDVKTKTINWCNKMQKTGLLSSDQFDECVSTFKTVESGVLPKEFKVPKTGISRNYSLYNTRLQNISPNVSGENTNKVLLVNNMGLYLACDTNNTIYFVKDINDSSVNQQEIYFTLIPQNDSVYSIMSSYGKYLIANAGSTLIDDASSNADTKDSNIPSSQSSRQDWCSTFTGKTMGPMTSWNVKKYESDGSNDTLSIVTFEPVQISNFFLSTNQNSLDNSLQIVYGSDDTTRWNIIPKTEGMLDAKAIDTSPQYIVAKDNILTKLSSIKSQIICIQAFKDSLNKLQDLIRSNYVNIKDYMTKVMNNQKPIPTLSSREDVTSENDIFENVEEFTNNNIYMTTNDKYSVINNITNTENSYLQQIEVDINAMNNLLVNLRAKDSETVSDYQNYLSDVSSKILDVKSRIKSNNEIMNRQKINYDKLNSDFTYIDNKKDKTKNIDKISKLNIDLISKYSNSNAFLVKAYPFIIFIIFLVLLYLIYKTYNKFIVNIYNHY